ncbi:hypothetical protein [Acidovorax sp.]|uniref:hypothetical protein n=1 Tax=Acidovorax sp. TaxID=1872122 RepID=UPI0025BB0C73|nr:hypothetical protein [Acidovorax sp.]MBW8465525.1 hypothetical protein [Acidovorax sp.]
MTTNTLPTRIFVLCNAGYDDDFIFSKSRAKRLNIPLQSEPIGCINNLHSKKSYFVYLPILDSPQLLKYVRKINELRAKGFYPGDACFGFTRDAYLRDPSPIPLEHLASAKKYAAHRLEEAKKGIINPMYPFDD